VAILERLEASQQPPATKVFSTPSSPTQLMPPALDRHMTPTPVFLGPLDGPADARRSDDSLDGTTARLELLQLGMGNEAWHDPTDAPEEETLAISPADPQVRPHAPVSLATNCGNNYASSDLVDFLGDIGVLIQPPLATTPPTKKKGRLAKPMPSPRRSGRLAIKRKTRLAPDGTLAVQELIARVVGILAPSASFDDASWDAYQQVFQHALLASLAIQAMEALVKHIKKLKKKGPAAAVPPTVTSVPDV
jgi:hypothetical protein